MDTRYIAEEYRLTHWAGIMRERKESGLSIKAYCEGAGIHANVYFYWQKKLREAACQGLVPPPGPEGEGIVPSGWAVCDPAPEAVGPVGSVIIEIGKCRITATAGADPDLLGKVCRALLSQC